MKKVSKIDLSKNIVAFNDDSEKLLDNYIFELEDRLIKVHDLLKDYEDVDPNAQYTILGETLFEVMDILENRK